MKTKNYSFSEDDTIAIHESKKSDKVVKFQKLNEYPKECSRSYWRTILYQMNNGALWGIYYTKTGRIKATFI